MVALTIGMATYDDFDGVYFSLQALRLYQDLSDTELLVIDNFGCEHTRSLVEQIDEARYILATDVVGTAAGRDLLFREGRGDTVLCLDSHVLLVPGAVARLKDYVAAHPESNDLLQGPLLYDDLRTISTHFEPEWREQMWGVWGTDPRGVDPEGEPFEIPMQGLGVFACRRSAWPGFNPRFRGFGGEEGYIHEKIRQAGGRCLCLPWFRWLHRFGRPKGVPYPLSVEDKLRNYVIGHTELGLDLAPVIEHFREQMPPKRAVTVAAAALRETAGVSLEIGSAPISPPDIGQPLVSCICMTYNRAPDHVSLIEEAVESFLRQTYPRKELILINDCPEQELVCDAPGVRVINVPERYPTLGDKHNAAVRFSRGELIAPWDDDDISLPWRLEHSVASLGAADLMNPRRYWFLDGSGLHLDHAMGVGHIASLFRRDAWEAVGGYPAISLGVDAEMDQRLRAWRGNVVDPLTGDPPLEPEAWFYIYRWGVSPMHLSANGNPTLYETIGAQTVASGRFVIRPRWRRDYVAETRAALARGPLAPV